MSMNFKMTSYVDQINKRIIKEEKKLRVQGAVHIRKKMRDNVSNSARSTAGDFPAKSSGNLKRGIKYRNQGEYTFVGTTSPAYHAHLLEFGTIKRVTNKGAFRGEVRKRPFFLRTFLEEKESLKKILSQRYF